MNTISKKGWADQITTLLRLGKPSPELRLDSPERQRAVLADVCRLLDNQVRRMDSRARQRVARAQLKTPHQPRLTPRLRETLHRLLAGDSEKEIAKRLALSKHTVH